MKSKKAIEVAYINSPLNNPMPNYAVYVMSRTEKIFVSLISFIVGGCVGLIFYGNLFMVDGFATVTTHISNGIVFTVVGLLAIKFITPMYRKKQMKKRNLLLKKQFSDMLESLSASFSSGSNVQNAFESAAEDLKMQYEEKDIIVTEMNEIINGMKQNISVESMLRNFGERSGNEDIQSFADVFSVCYRKGGNMNSVMRRTHDVLSDKMAVSDEIDTKLTSNKMQHNVMSIMPIIVVAMLRFTNKSLSANFTTPLGVIINTIAIGIFVGAYIYGNKIIDIKE